jgi:protein-L-isoaspartate(D-aspartate) O-methyltransferase
MRTCLVRPRDIAVACALTAGIGVPVAIAWAQATEAELELRRADMVERQIRQRGVADGRVLAAMRTVPRHRFVPAELMSRAYEDTPLPIGDDQTISQPYIVGYMTEALGVRPEHSVLEIGTGSGYQAAVLAQIARTVYTIEIVPPLARRAAATLESLGYQNVHVRAGDGYAGWPEHAPFDRILVTAAPEQIPAPLLEQLAPRGRLVIPVGAQGRTQWITIVDKRPEGLVERRTIPVQFVPFTRDR